MSRVAKSASTNVQRGGFSSYRVAPHQIRPANCRLATLWRTDVPQSWRTSLPKMSAKKREDKTKPCNRKSRCLVSSLTPRARYNFLESSLILICFIQNLFHDDIVHHEKHCTMQTKKEKRIVFFFRERNKRDSSRKLCNSTLCREQTSQTAFPKTCRERCNSTLC